MPNRRRRCPRSSHCYSRSGRAALPHPSNRYRVDDACTSPATNGALGSPSPHWSAMLAGVGPNSASGRVHQRCLPRGDLVQDLLKDRERALRLDHWPEPAARRPTPPRPDHRHHRSSPPLPMLPVPMLPARPSTRQAACRSRSEASRNPARWLGAVRADLVQELAGHPARATAQRRRRRSPSRR